MRKSEYKKAKRVYESRQLAQDILMCASDGYDDEEYMESEMTRLSKALYNANDEYLNDVIKNLCDIIRENVLS